MTKPTTELERLKALEWDDVSRCLACEALRQHGHNEDCWLGERIREMTLQQQALERAGATTFRPLDVQPAESVDIGVPQRPAAIRRAALEEAARHFEEGDQLEHISPEEVALDLRTMAEETEGG